MRSAFYKTLSSLLVPIVKQSSWTDEEDQLLIEIVNSNPTAIWKYIAQEYNSRLEGTIYHLNNRNFKSCCERYTSHLDPNLRFKGGLTNAFRDNPDQMRFLVQFLIQHKKDCILGKFADLADRFSPEFSKKFPPATNEGEKFTANSLKNIWNSSPKFVSYRNRNRARKLKVAEPQPSPPQESRRHNERQRMASSDDSEYSEDERYVVRPTRLPRGSQPQLLANVSSPVSQATEVLSPLMSFEQDPLLLNMFSLASNPVTFSSQDPNFLEFKRQLFSDLNTDDAQT